MLSFTICGGFAPWARTDGACAASASPTAVERTEAASRRLLMIGPLVGVSWRDLGGSPPRPQGYTSFAKIHCYRRGATWCMETAGIRRHERPIQERPMSP